MSSLAPDLRDPGACCECGLLTRYARWVGGELEYCHPDCDSEADGYNDSPESEIAQSDGQAAPAGCSCAASDGGE